MFEMSDAILETCVTASMIYKQQQSSFITTGCTSIDQCLKGGIIRNSITEIVGEASAGKTQLAIQLAVHSILPEKNFGVNGRTLYIETEGGFPLTRLKSIATAFCKRNKQYNINDITENIFIHSVPDFDALVNLIDSLESRLEVQEGSPIRLVIIDSIASLFRGELKLDYLKRSEILRHVYYTMNALCQSKNLTFVVINQITAFYSDTFSKLSGNFSIPFLNNTVTQFTHNRIMVCRRNSTAPAPSVLGNSVYHEVCSDNRNEVESDQIRDLYVLLSPYIGCRKTSFTVTADGVVSL